MSDLMDSMRTETGLTENGMKTNVTTLNACTDLFFQIGAMRGQDEKRLIAMFSAAYGENPLVAMKLLFWVRDIRGGAGERKIFRTLTNYLYKTSRASMRKNLSLIPEFGRWDDLFQFLDTDFKSDVLNIIKEGLDDPQKVGLLSKWLPRPNNKTVSKKRWANIVRSFLGLTPKAYRKLLVENSTTVEQLMCAKKFDDIDFSKLPSKAMANYMTAFHKNSPDKFQAYIESLQKGETTINAGAVYPYDIIKALKNGNTEISNEQWKALPNFMEESNERVLPLVDVSGSMSTMVNGNPNLDVLDIAISLGLYISERNEGIFQDGFITFSSRPKLEVLKGDLSMRYNQLRRSDWDMNTNLIAAFDLILSNAVKGDISEDEMPTMLLILSDMEFDEATSNSGWGRYEIPEWNLTAQQAIAMKYEVAGYKVPKIVYWNLASRQSNMPVQYNEEGTALISGFSPSILKSILGGHNMTPESIMFKTIDTERYETISI